MKKLISFLILFVTIILPIIAQDGISKGSKVKIIEIGKDDAYYAERIDFLGKDVIALGELSKKSNGFYSGTVETETGRTCFFTDFKVSLLSVKTKPAESGFSPSSTIPKGTRIKVIEVPSDDAFYSDKEEIEGQTGTLKSELEVDSEGYTSGRIDLDNGKDFYFFKVKLGKASGTSPSSSPKISKEIKFISGTIKKGTVVYLAEISSDDSYYDDRFEKIGLRGTVDKSDMTMKEDGYYSGDFKYDDGSTAYFYKAKFSKEPVNKLEKSKEDTKSVQNDDVEWKEAKNDDNIKEGDQVEITAISPEDSYYEDKDEYVGQKGIADSDIDHDSKEDGYGGTIKLENGDSPYFFLIKLKKTGNLVKTKTENSSSGKYPKTISKNTKVRVVDVSKDDSFFSDKSKYLRKTGKVAELMNLQEDGFYSGKILFDDGTDAYFYKVKVSIQ